MGGHSEEAAPDVSLKEETGVNQAANSEDGEGGAHSNRDGIHVERRDLRRKSM